MAAVDAGRLRNLLQHINGLIAELRALPLDNQQTRLAYPRIFELVRLVKRFLEVVAALPDDAQKQMWSQRGAWLQEEIAALAQERIYSSDQKVYFMNLILLLFAGADACDSVLRDKAELEMAAVSHAQQIQDLEGRLRAAEAVQAEHVLVPKALAEEALEAKSKLVVAQQELAKRGSGAEEMARKLQAAAAETEVLRARVAELQEEVATLHEVAEKRVEVIQVLMEKTEHQQSLTSEHAKLTAHCSTLSANMEANAKVVEKLVELNLELMDRLNTLSANAARAAAASGGGAAAGPSTSGLGAPSIASISSTGTTVSQGGGGPPSGQTWAGAHVRAGFQNGQSAVPTLGLATPYTGYGLPAGGGPGPGTATTHGTDPGGALASHEPSSLADAFAMFLANPGTPEKATAASIARPG